jgi:threonine dehydratase
VDWNAEIAAAEQRIAPHVVRTPLIPVHGTALLIKAEFQQPTGSFKVRGAINAVLSCAEEARTRGVCTYSTGNHGRALAWAASIVGARCTVFVSSLCPPFKRAALQEAGATLVVAGASQDEAQVEAEQAARSGMLLLPPFNDPLVIAGQATAMCEILLDRPDVGTVIVPVSGGGLAAGAAVAAEAAGHNVKLIGVSMEGGAAMHASLAAGRPVAVEEQESLADSLGGGVGGADSLTYPIVERRFASVELVSEAAIARAMVRARRELGLILEGAAATSLALALDARAASFAGLVVLLATGGNVDPSVIDGLEEGCE